MKKRYRSGSLRRRAACHRLLRPAEAVLSQREKPSSDTHGLYNPRVHGDATLSLMLATAVSTALFHTLIPDHWLPFVLIGRARGWSLGTTAMVSGFSALLHAGLSILLALVTLVIGLETAHARGIVLERASGVLLLVFGLAYALWAWRKGGHFHPGGSLLHRHAHADCDGREGDEGE